MITCKHCNKKYKPLGISGHERYCKDNPLALTKGFGGAKKGTIPWNKGLETKDDVKSKISKALIGKSKGVGQTIEIEERRKLAISKSMKKNPAAGGLRRGSGRGIKGTYMGYWCDSTWELAWVIYNIDHDIKFDRNLEGFEYTYEGRIHKYYPDFIINDVYYEIKGRRSYEDLDNKTKAKINNFNKEIKVLYLHEMKPIIKYVIDAYGKEFYNLYE